MEQKQSQLNPGLINFDKPSDVEYWSKRFGTTPERLKEIVERVGNSPAFIAKLLHK